MVDVGAKDGHATAAPSRARSCAWRRRPRAAVAAGDAPKGDVLGTARIAGIQAAKRTGELIPLCHPLGLDHVDVRRRGRRRRRASSRSTAEAAVDAHAPASRWRR